MNTSLRLAVADSSQAGEARRVASAWARALGCGDEIIAAMALVITELGNNLALHTRGGLLLVRTLSAPAQTGLEVMALDDGPGLANFGECLRDGFSTRGTAGGGLGAVQRQSRAFEVHSQPGIGTAILSELWPRPKRSQGEDFQTGAVSVPLATYDACGDSWAGMQPAPGRFRVIVADGLGHGEMAADASRKAVAVFLKTAADSLPTSLETMHAALRETRGAAVAIAEIDLNKRQVSCVGIGNISATIISDTKTTSLVSHNGTVGAQFRVLKEFHYAWPLGSVLVMHSDGIRTNWQPSRYLGLLHRAPALIAGVLYRDYHRANDDATIVVARGAA